VGGILIKEQTKHRDSFVLLTSWQSVEQHMGSAMTDGFEEYAQIRAFIEAVRMKHAKRLHVGIEKVA